nr:ribosomal protein S subunit 2 [Haplopteris ensiformis]UQV94740.1 ribosomal protein S subunit 2 [Haplopteris ensiformis]
MVSSLNSEKWEKSYYSEGERNRIFQRMLSMSAHLGFSEPPARYYPIYLNGLRSSRTIIDLNKTLCFMRSACNCIRALVNNKGHLLLVNTDPLCNDIIKQMGKRANQSYINSKWIGGFLTNWGHMIHDKHLRFPNKADFCTRFLRRQRSYEGLKTREIPDGLVTLNAHRNFYAICEAHRLRMPIVSLVDSILPENLYRLVTHPIPVNNDSIWVTNLFSLLVTKTVIHSVRAQIINKRKGPKGGYNPYYVDSRGTKNSINKLNVRSYCTSSSDSDTEDTNLPCPSRYEFGSSSNANDINIRERAFSLYQEFKEDRNYVNSVKEELNFSSMELSDRDLRTFQNNPVFTKLHYEMMPKIENIVTEFANSEQGSKDHLQIAHGSANVLNSCELAQRALSSLLVNEPVESREHLLDQVKSVDQTLDSVASTYNHLLDVSGGNSSDSSGNEGDRENGESDSDPNAGGDSSDSSGNEGDREKGDRENGESDSDPNDGDAFDFMDFFISVCGIFVFSGRTFDCILFS